ncbi:acetyltransferase [Oceanicola sp. 22II-s10i]|uniref:GNAT family N-acetyltransferase n=1 Tax=Oceanicola sp. 22II-s10i TaxID=1317116 RepID=UPI000B74456E|nr:GNAT family N-acetyltransferase [Oceanicola sp. 22II-s10i]OWU84849.1 acetyltransferase [Oceanicola sp. 22II-s10i]
MTNIHLARPEDADRLLAMVAACHDELGIRQSDADRAAALAPLLDGSPHGVAYMIGPVRAPIGYTVISFGWSLAYGGLAGQVQDIWIRPGVRRRGIGTEVLYALPKALAQAGLCALSAAAPPATPTEIFFRRARFANHDDSVVMTLRL